MLPQYNNNLYPNELSVNMKDTWQHQMREGYHPSPTEALHYSIVSNNETIATNIQNDPMKLCEVSSTASDQNPTIVPAKGQKNIPLPSSFSPRPSDVICSRGREARNHPGNVLLRSLINQSVRAYENAQSRADKSRIVSDILFNFGWSPSPNQVCDGSGDEEMGGFVKQDNVTSRWYVIGEASAREKIGQSLRDRLHGKYKSSTKAKRRRNKILIQKQKEEQKRQVAESVKNMTNLRMNVLGESLKETVGNEDPEDPSFDSILEEQMTKANSELLNLLKQCS